MKDLYGCFCWPGTVWIYSDPHFGHRKVLQYERPQFKTIEEHDQAIVDLINSTITPNDTLVCLGDVGFEAEKSLAKIKACKKKILLRGNHDKNIAELRPFFDEIYEGPIFVNRFVILSHEPVPTENCFFNIHGHLHNSNLDTPNYINANIGVNGFKLIKLSDVMKRIGSPDIKRLKAPFLKEWYADHYVFLPGESRKDVFIYSDTGHIIPKDKVEALYDGIYEMYGYDPRYDGVPKGFEPHESEPFDTTLIKYADALYKACVI